MKKTIYLMVALVCAFSLVACSANTSDESTQSQQLPESEDSSVAQGETEAPEENLPNEKVFVAGASVYRGTATRSEDGETSILTQAAGTDYGSETMSITIDENTTGETEIVDGDYIEVFYGRSPEGEFDFTATHNVIGINILGNEQNVIFNGTVTAFEQEEGTLTRLTMTQLETEQEIVFNVSPETQVRLTVEDIAVGDMLNIYHKGMLTRSIPAQGVPIEISPMK